MKRLLSWLIFILMITATVSAQRGIYDLPDPYADVVSISSTIARTRAGRILASNTLTDSVTLLDLDRSIQAEFAIGLNPNGVTITPNNLRGLAVSESNLAVINLETAEVEAGYDLDGHPFGVVADADFAYVSLQSADEIAVVNLETGDIDERITTPPAPSGLAKWGDYLYVTHFWTGELSLIYLPLGEVVRTIQPNPQGSLFASIELNPIHGMAYLPMSIANEAETATEGNRIIPMLYEVDLRLMSVIRSINLASADQNVNIPYAVRQPSNRSRLYIAQAGSDSVTVLNLDTAVADTHFETGANPRGLVFNGDYTQIYTQDTVDGVISLFDTRFFGLTDQIPVSTMPIDPQEQIASRLFHTATDDRLSNNGLMSCASCHWGGQSDGRTWLGNLTPAIEDDAPVDADWLNEHIAELQGGSGFPVDGIDMTALITFLQGSE